MFKWHSPQNNSTASAQAAVLYSECYTFRIIVASPSGQCVSLLLFTWTDVNVNYHDFIPGLSAFGPQQWSQCAELIGKLIDQSPLYIDFTMVAQGTIPQTPVSGSCCLPLAVLQSMWATWCKYRGKVDISVDKIFWFKLFFLGFCSVCLPNIYFNILKYLSTLDLLSFNKSDL